MNKDRITFNTAEVAEYYRMRLPKLSQRGHQWRGPCPIHHGKDYNFTVESATGLWKCHSQCGRGGSLIDFEMALTGADFKAALATVCTTVGRPMPERARMTRDEWRAAQDAHERAQHELVEALYFADAARYMAEWALEVLSPTDRERATHTAILAALRVSPEAEYRAWLEDRPEWAAALVRASRARARRLRVALARYLMAEMSNAA